MKKRFLALMISVTMMAVLCTGCGEKETTSGDETKVSVEESNEATPAPVSEERVEESVPESSEEVVESTVESKEEVAESEDVTTDASEERLQRWWMLTKKTGQPLMEIISRERILCLKRC